ncbi:family 43 glycosylhydrolase [Paenibacillus xylanilyticus]|uniref:family 43 glycosylhydrolase n=1 Tax=Paenibacillus xylanilyticus TaxID=248903 RepID=UPI0013893D72|nr:family 43 glycosylhydrolase [Paenibacillus xylanilyticus]
MDMNGLLDKLALNDCIPMGAILTENKLKLPALVNGMPIKWVSSHPAIITNEGKVTLPEKLARVTLQAAISGKGQSVRRDYVIPVVPKNEQAAYFCDNFSIPYVLVPGNTLHRQFGLGTIHWTGSLLVDTAGNILAPEGGSETVSLVSSFRMDGSIVASKTFEVRILGNDFGSVLAYTRVPMEDEQLYSTYLAYSLHLAYRSHPSKTYQSLHYNSGILYATATISTNNTIKEKGLRNPYLFHATDGTFGVVAVRINADGSADHESRGCILLWKTNDLISFTEIGQVHLGVDAYVREVTCKYNSSKGKYEIHWCDYSGKYYRNDMEDLYDVQTVSEPVPGRLLAHDMVRTDIEGAVEANVIEVEGDFGRNLLLRRSPLMNEAIEVPETAVIKTIDDIHAITATAIYTDGSKAVKQVKWNTDDINFHQSGSYEITGTVIQQFYPFPVAVDRADPHILRWQDKYYFIATNDDNGNIGLYVREADTIQGLFAPDTIEHVVLDKDELRGYTQTFWAPEFHAVGNDLYIFFAVSSSVWGPQAHIMKLKNQGRILNASDWELPIRMVNKDGVYLGAVREDGEALDITLDMTYLEVDGGSYVIWSWRRWSPEDSGSMLFIATIDPARPWQLTSDPVLITRPLYGWENNRHTINNEGPYCIVTDDYILITYSGGSANEPTYVVGTLTAKRGTDLLNPGSWVKSNAPVLSSLSVEKEYGPGHNSFVTDEYGNLMLVYHGIGPNPVGKRSVGLRRVHFNRDRLPVFDLSPDRDLNQELTQVKLRVIVEP